MASGQMNAHRETMKALLDILYENLCDGSPYTLQNIIIRLFQNDYTPVCQSTEEDFDEADFSGYAGITLTAGDPCTGIVETGLNEEGIPTLFFDQEIWTQTATTVTNVIYGMYAVATISGDPDGPLLLASQRFANGPFAMDAIGNIIKASGFMKLDCQMAPLP